MVEQIKKLRVGEILQSQTCLYLVIWDRFYE